MTRGEGVPVRLGQKAAGSPGETFVASDARENRTSADPDVWRDRAEQARAHAGRLRDPNIQTALLSIAEGLDRLGLRARDARRSEPPLTAGGDATPAAFDLNGGLGATAQPAATRQAGEAMTDMRDQVQLKLDETDRTDLSLADTFCAMKALASNPQSPPGAIPDRIERVARALCQADGRDPDRSIETGQWQTVLSGGHETQRPVTLRGWKVYEKDAKQFVAALDAALDRS